MKKLGFDHGIYIERQSHYILERVKGWDKLYLEFGGKLMQDMHAKRCLPGYRENAKLELLCALREKAEIIICVYAGDIERSKKRGDFGNTYASEVFRLIDDLRANGLDVNSVVITRFEGQPAAQTFEAKLKTRGIRTWTHAPIAGYPHDVDSIVSEEGYGKNPYVETTKPIVVVTAPGPGSGKLATCLNQLYHEKRLGRRAGYAKFETFPVWNLPIKHPLNVAYEAATVDLKDFNQIDSFHLEAYGKSTVNYNRDMEMFPVVRRMIERITGESIYKSPTDMGVNQIGTAIIDDEVVREASRQEIIRRYLKTVGDYKKGVADEDALNRMKMIMESQNLKTSDRAVVGQARAHLERVQKRFGTTYGLTAVAVELPDGSFVTGRNSEMMTAPAAAILNTAKALASLPDHMHLLSNSMLEPMLALKTSTLKMKKYSLGIEEILTVLALSAVTNPLAQAAMDALPQLEGCQAHSTTFITPSDEKICNKLGINITCDDAYLTESLYYI